MEAVDTMTTAKSVRARPPSTVGTKRKRDPTPKFYAVQVGKEPGIYNSWHDCLAQVRGFPKPIFKSFTSLTDAENYLHNKGGEKVTKYYGVRSGRTPGVYTNWRDVLDQITGWKGPKHRGFDTRTQAEQYVAEGLRSSANGAENSAGNTEMAAPAAKKAKVSKAKKSNPIKEEELSRPTSVEQGEYEPGEAPLPDDAQDGFDSSVVLDPTTNGLRFRTGEEQEKMTYQAVRPVKDAAIRIYTDGSSLSNGHMNSCGGVGVYFGPEDGRNISEPLQGGKQTNQRAELTAFARALEVAPKDRRIVIVSDSKYAIDCVTSWFQNWRKNGWLTSTRKPVENRDLVQRVVDMLEDRLRLHGHHMDDDDDDEEDEEGDEEKKKKTKKAKKAKVEQEEGMSSDKRAYWDSGPGGVRFEWVKGHDKDDGNTAADNLAVAGARTAQELVALADL